MSASIHTRLADALDALMAARGLSNNELGRKAGVAPNTIANYRKRDEPFTSTGKPRSAKLAEIERIAGALNIDPIELLQGRVQAIPAQGALPLHEPATPPLAPLEQDLLAAFRQLPEEEQERMARDAMARAEAIERLVTRALTKRGIPVTGYAADLRVERAFGRVPASQRDERQATIEDVTPESTKTSRGGGQS